MYTKYIWRRQQTEMKILGKQTEFNTSLEGNVRRPQSALSAKCHIVQAGVHKYKARLQQKSHIKACLRQPFIISRYTSEKYWCKKCYQFCYTFSFQSWFHCLSKTGHVSSYWHVNFQFTDEGERKFVALMKTPCTFWQTQVPPGCLLAMKLFHISFIIWERQENTSSFLLRMSKLVKTTETQIH